MLLALLIGAFILALGSVIFMPSHVSLLALFNAAINLMKNGAGEREKTRSSYPELSAQPMQESNENIGSSVANKKTITLNDSVFGLANRFIEIFEAHGIHVNEIPKLIPKQYGVTRSVLSSSHLVVKVLEQDKLIDWTCATFGVREDWFVKGEPPIYDTEEYYDDVHSLLRLLKGLRSRCSTNLEIIALKNVKRLGLAEVQSRWVNLLILKPIVLDGKVLTSGDKTVYKYIPTRTLWNWSHWRSRYQFKSIVKLCHEELGLIFSGRTLNSKEMSELAQGNIFPRAIVDKTFGNTWYPYDYTYIEAIKENPRIEETYEIAALLNYLEEQRYRKVFQKDSL